MLEAEDTDPERGGRLGRFIRNLEYLYKWLLLGVVVGVVAGFGAVVFYLALRYTTHFLLGYVAGYHLPTPLVEGGSPGSSHYQRPWALPLVTTGGALVSALIVAKFAPEASGHGTDSAIEAIHTDPRHIRGRVVLVKMVSSALTIGSGGSAGREGPTAQISAGFASMLARRLHLSDADGRILVSLGVGAGIGAIFGAPLGGAVLAASIIYREDLEYGTLYPGFVTSATAYAVFGSFLGFDPMFGYVDAEYRFEDAWPLLWFVVLGIVAAAVGYLYARIFYATEALTARLSVPGGAVLMPTVGGLLVGLLGLALPQILSSGYGWVQGDDQDGIAGDSVVDRAGPADRENRRDVVVHRHRRLGRNLRARDRHRGVRGRGGLAAGRHVPSSGRARQPGHLRGGRDDGVFRQRRACAVGHLDHGGRDDRIVLGGARRDHRGWDRLTADASHQGVDLPLAAPQPRNRRSRAPTRRGHRALIDTTRSAAVVSFCALRFSPVTVRGCPEPAVERLGAARRPVRWPPATG